MGFQGSWRLVEGTPNSRAVTIFVRGGNKMVRGSWSERRGGRGAQELILGTHLRSCLDESRAKKCAAA